MKVRLIAALCAVFIASTGFACPERGPCQAAHAGGLTYLSGGVGDEEITALSQSEKDFNLKMVFAEADGAYTTDVDVDVRDAKGKVRFAEKNLGPIVLLRLPEGTYEISATSREKDKVVQKRVRVAKARQNLIFVWK